MHLIKRWMFAAGCVLLFLSAVDSWAQGVEIANIPNEILHAVELGPFAQSYTVDGSLNPFYLRGDFDGDGKADYALASSQRSTMLQVLQSG
jgi:hypothetical protein